MPLLGLYNFMDMYNIVSVFRGKVMEAISYSRLRANLANVMDRVVNDHDAVIVTRKSEPGVVILSLEDFEAMQETTYLMRSPANAKALMESISQLENGKTKSFTTTELKEKFK